MADDQLPFLQDRLSIHLLYWSQLRMGSSWNAADVCSTYWRLYIHNRGGAALRLTSGRYEISPGAVHFIPPWVRFSCLPEPGIEHFYVHFDTLGLPGVVIRDVFAAPLAVSLEPTLERLLSELQETERSRRQDLSVLFRVKSLVYLSLAKLFAALPEEQGRRCRLLIAGQHSVQPALRHIEDHLEASLSNDELAGLCNYSVDHFIRLFREVVGQSPAQYVIERRIAQAAKLLLFTSQSIEQIAESTGFPNRFYFSRVFKQRMGVPPATYRHTDRV